MKESDSGCKGCVSCSCKDVNTEDVKLAENGHYTAPDGTVYEIGKEYFAEPGKVYVNDYGVFLAKNKDHRNTALCGNCCAALNMSDENGDSLNVAFSRAALCGILPRCEDLFTVTYKCLQSNYGWLKVSEIKGAE